MCCALILAGMITATGEDHFEKSGKGTTAPDKTVRFTIHLRDDSHLLGVPSIKSLPIKTAFAMVDLPLKLVESISFEDDQETAKLLCINGDELRGVINMAAITLNTSFGNVVIPLKSITRISSQFGSIKRGCILYYAFDRDENDRITDQSGKGNHGKAHGSKWTPQGKVGGARTFNGESDYISIDYNEKSGLFPAVTPVTVAAWFNTSSGSPIQQQVIFATHYAGIGRDGYFLCVDTRSLGGKALWFPTNMSGTIKSESAVNDGQWHHAVGVWDGKESSLYIDGILQGKAAASDSLVYEHRASFQIGHVENNGAPHARDEFYYFKGTIDEVMVFDRALTPGEIQNLYGLRQTGADSD